MDIYQNFDFKQLIFKLENESKVFIEFFELNKNDYIEQWDIFTELGYEEKLPLIIERLELIRLLQEEDKILQRLKFKNDKLIAFNKKLIHFNRRAASSSNLIKSPIDVAEKLNIDIFEKVEDYDICKLCEHAKFHSFHDDSATSQNIFLCLIDESTRKEKPMADCNKFEALGNLLIGE